MTVEIKQIVRTIIDQTTGIQNTCQIALPTTPITRINEFRITSLTGLEKN